MIDVKAKIIAVFEQLLGGNAPIRINIVDLGHIIGVGPAGKVPPTQFAVAVAELEDVGIIERMHNPGDWTLGIRGEQYILSVRQISDMFPAAPLPGAKPKDGGAAESK